MIEETLKITGSLDVTLYDEFNNVKQQFTVPNMVVTTGKTVIASRLVGTTAAVMSHMAVGTDNGTILPLAAGNTQLGAALGARTALSSGTSSNNVVTYSATFGAGVSTGALVEAGVFNALTGGSMLCRTVFPVINKDTADTLTINWNVTIN